MEPNAELKKLMKEFGLTKDSIWNCHGTWVMLHRGCETVAQAMNMTFDEPKVLAEHGEAVALLVTGHITRHGQLLPIDLPKDGTIVQVPESITSKESAWSIGEASPKNNKNAYPWAMAEKRAKDRVILKLARFSEVGVYSEIEADDFKKQPPNARQSDNDKQTPAMEETLDAMGSGGTFDDMDKIMQDNAIKALRSQLESNDEIADWMVKNEYPKIRECTRAECDEIIKRMN